MLYSFLYLPYLQNDEEVITDSIRHQIHYLNCTPAHSVGGIEGRGINITDWEVFPNPVNNIINIQSGEKFLLEEITIVNALGETLLKQNALIAYQVQIDVSHLKNGIYILKLVSNNKSYTTKLIKQCTN